MTSRHIVSDNYNDIYHRMLANTLFTDLGSVDPITGHHEQFNTGFTLLNVNNNVVDSEKRNFNLIFAEQFYQWTVTGQSDIRKLYDFNANAKNFADDNDDNLQLRNTAYGPRIQKQLPFVLEELIETSSSRRAVINILEADDKLLLSAKRAGETKIEFPCACAITYYIRNGKLNCHVSMRSNCLSKTICYDVYIQTELMKHICKTLNAMQAAKCTNPDAEPGLEVGQLEWNIVNAHVLAENVQYSKDIVQEYENKLVSAN